MKKYPLDKICVTNTDYTLEPYKAYVIQEIGTDDTANVTIRIDGKTCGVITNYLAPMRKTASNMGGPLKLGDYKLVVPPGKTMRFDGTAAKNVLIIGYMLDLAPGESLPSDLLNRFGNQDKEYMTVVSGSAVSTGTAWADGAEISLYSLVPTTIEQYLFNNRVVVRQVAAGSPAEAEGNVGVRFYVDGAPLDNLPASAGKRGIARFNLDVPGTGTNTMEPFDLEDTPILLGGDHSLDVKAMNVSGGSLFGTTAAQFQFLAAAVYRKVG